MKKDSGHKKQKEGYVLFLVFAVAVIGIGFGSITMEFARRVIHRENPAVQEAGRQLDFEAEYPFPGDTGEEYALDAGRQEASSSFPGRIWGRYLSLMGSVREMLSNTKYYIPAYYHYLELRGLADRLEGIEVFEGNTKVVRLTDGRLAWYESGQTSEEENEKLAASVGDFARFAKDAGSEFLYVQTPCGIDAFDPRLPIGVTDYSNSNYDLFCQGIRQQGLDVLDLRESIEASEFTIPELFYRTDHHWTSQGALLGTVWTANYLNDRLGAVLDTGLLSPDRFHSLLLEGKNLGAEGRKVSAGYAAPEEMELLIPDYDTAFRVEHPGAGLSFSGSFEQVMFDWDIFDPDHLYETAWYEAQLHGLQPLTIIHNEMAENDIKIMVIGNSMSLSMVPFLSLMVKEVDLIDYRAELGFDGSYRSFLEQTKPDYCILMAVPNESNLFQFGEKRRGETF